MVCLFNFVVDPYGLFQIVEIRGFNQQKEGVRSKIRYVKALELPLRAPRTIIIGSSRVHDGINPEHPLLQTSPPVYNLGIDMLRIHEAVKFLEHAVKNTQVKEVIFGVDFFMFNGCEKVNPVFDERLVGRKIVSFDYVYQPLLTLTALADSLRTIKQSYSQPQRKEFLSDGYRPGKFVFHHAKDYAKLHYYTNWIFLSSKPMSTPYYGKYQEDDQTFKEYELFLLICKRENIKCTVFITPAHANLDGEGIRMAGLWNSFENWKRRLTSITSKYDISLYDFSGYNAITTEEIKTPMTYFWDSSHFTESTTDLILKRLFDGSSKPDRTLPLSGFGVLLTPENIDSHLDVVRDSRARYAQTHPADVLLIKQMFEQTTSGRPFPKGCIPEFDLR